MSSLNAFISADIEGISGWVQDDESRSAAKAAMVADVNAAIEGLLDAHPDASVTVADAHGDKRTIQPADLHECASLLRGGPRPYGMVDGASSDNDLAFFIGYHDRPGSGGFAEHTFSGSIDDIRLNGHSVGEFELNAVLLADWGVPVTLVTGDDHLRQNVANRIPDAEYVTTKTARSATGAICEPLDRVRTDIHEAATSAVTDPPSKPTSPVPIDTPVTVAIDYRDVRSADIASLWPEVERAADSRTVTHEATDIPTAYQFTRACVLSVD